MSSPLDALAPLATTGVGSLPFVDLPAAARHATRAYDLPFCPQLPVRDGDMIREWLGADPRRCGWTADRDRRRPAVWAAFLDELEARASRSPSPAVKLQVTGPVTLAIALERGSRTAARADSLCALAGQVATWVATTAAEQVRILRERGSEVVLLADEPGLAHAGLDPGRTAHAAIWDPLRVTGAAAWGMHICGPVPWELVLAVGPQILSLDVARHGLDAQARGALGALLDRGARIAWGVIDPVDPGGASAVAGRATACLAAVADDGPMRPVAARSLLTPACGTGRLSPTRERLVAALLAAARTAVVAAVEASATAPPGRR